jgi:hypothetical protein
LKLSGQDVDDPDETDTAQNKPGGRVPEPDQESVNNRRNDQNIKEILDPETMG